jgi:PAS domain S-box-containing protein
MIDNSVILINQLRATLGKMEVALGAIVEAIVWTDDQGRVHWSNTTFDRLVNQQRFQVLGTSLFNLLPLEQHGQELSLELHPLSKILNGQANVNGIYEFQQASKSLVLEISSTRLVFHGQQTSAIIVIRDITERQRFEQRQSMQFAVTQVLAESTTIESAIPKLLQAICCGTGWELGAMWQQEPNTNLLRWESSWQNPFLEATEFAEINRKITFNPGIGLPGRVWATGKPAWITDVLTDGNFPRATFAAQARLHGAFAFPIFNGDEVTGVMEFFSRHPRQPDEDFIRLMLDVSSQINQFTERIRAKVLLEKERKFLSAVLNTVEAGIIACNPEEKVTLFNQAALDFYEISSPPSSVSQWIQNYDFYLPNGETKILPHERPLLRGLTGEQISNLEMMIISKAGKVHTVLASVQPIVDTLGKNLGAVLVMHDITERKQAEQERAQLVREQAARAEAEAAQQRITNILESITDGFISLDQAWCFTYLNREAEKLVNFKQQNRQTLIGKNIWQMFPGLVGSQFYKESHRALTEQVTVNLEEFFQILNKWFEIHIYSASEGLSIYFQDITEWKQAEVEIQKALEQEKELMELKSRFITTASHEFRTPLTTILTSSEILKAYNDRFTEAQKVKHLDRIQISVKEMTRLMEDILFLGKAEADRIECHLVNLNLKEFCREILEEMELIDKNNHQFVFDYQGSFSSVELDEKLMRQVLVNLLSNAIKYTPSRKNIYFKVISEAEQVTFQVQDEGIGIPTVDQQHLFKRFHRASNVGTISGTGLGMAIVKKAVDAQGGKISFETEVNVGTTFTVCVPIRI